MAKKKMPELSPEAQGGHRHTAAKIMSFVDLHDGEIFTDNTQFERNKQCKDCMYQSDGTVYTNDYLKCSCLIYQHPEMKPDYVFDNTGKCEDYEKDEAKLIESVLLGVAVGDALGVPFEFQPRGTFHAVDMVGHGTHDQPPGTWSDDTSLTLCLAWAMSKHWDTESILNETARGFLRWQDDAEFTAHGAVFDVGNATSKAINKLRKGMPPTKSGGDTINDNGNGSLMRIAPIAFFVAGRPQAERFDIVRKVSSITHAHPISVLSCIIYIEYLLKLLKGDNKFTAFEAVKKEIMAAIMKGDLNCYCNEITDYFMPLISTGVQLHTADKSDIKSGGFVVDTLKASIWCFLTTQNYRDAVLEAVNLGEDTDTTAAVTGGLAGAYYDFGNNGIPPEWIEALAKHDTISDIAEGVFASSKNP